MVIVRGECDERRQHNNEGWPRGKGGGGECRTIEKLTYKSGKAQHSFPCKATKKYDYIS